MTLKLKGSDHEPARMLSLIPLTCGSSVCDLTSVLSIKDFMGFIDFELVRFGLALVLFSVSECNLNTDITFSTFQYFQIFYFIFMFNPCRCQRVLNVCGP